MHDPGHRFGWKQDNNWWEISGLSPNSLCECRAKARNRDSVETGFCASTSCYTAAAIPGSAPFSMVTPGSIRANWSQNGNPSGTEYLCENITTSQTSGWITDTSWNCMGLLPATMYTFRVKARNHDGLETDWCILGTRMTVFTDNDGDGLPDSWEQQIIDDNPE